MLTFYYATQPRALFHLYDQCQIWMPENLPDQSQVWQPNQAVATCKAEYLNLVRDRILEGTLDCQNVIWIRISNKTATGHIFDSSGNVSNFFKII